MTKTVILNVVELKRNLQNKKVAVRQPFTPSIRHSLKRAFSFAFILT